MRTISRYDKNDALIRVTEDDASQGNTSEEPNGAPRQIIEVSLAADNRISWLQVSGSFILFFNSWGLINTWGSFQTFYERSLLSDQSPSSISWIGSLQVFLIMFTGAVTGPLFDAGYFRALITVGTFMVPLGLFMTSISSKFWHFILAQGFCVGFGAGTLFVPAIAILPQYFIEKRGLAIGIVSAGSSVGAVLYPIIFERLQENIGFRWSARSLGFIAFGTCCISQSIMRVRFTPSDRRRLVQFSAFKEPKYLVFCFALFMGYLSFYNFFFYVQSYATDTGIVGHELGLYLLSMLNAGSAFGRVIPNLIADHIGPLNVIAPVSTITTLMAFAWIGTHNAPGIIVLGILYGCASGGFMALPPLVLSALAEDDRHVGTRLGMSFAVASIGALIGTPIGGAIINDTKTYLGVQLFTACCLTTASVAFIALRFAQTGPRILTRV